MAVVLIAITPAIAYMDWMVFGKGNRNVDWKTWVPATFLEMTMLACGMLIGRLI